MGNLNHIYKLEAVVAGLKNAKFKQDLIKYITAVDRTTQRTGYGNNKQSVSGTIFDFRTAEFKAP
jgi:hypothetical protein